MGRPGQDGVADRLRDVHSAGGQHLGDEERVAASLRVEIARIDAVLAGERLDRCLGQRRKPDPLRPLHGRDLPEHHPQRIARSELVVAKRPDEHGRDLVDPPKRQTGNVERRRIRPMEILEHDDRDRGSAQIAQQGLGRLVRLRADVKGTRQLARSTLRHVAQRAQRARREQAVARPPPHDDRRTELADEGANQGRLADAGLAADEHRLAAAAAADPAEGSGQRCELLVPLEQ
ncbi:MAG: hypothetical protein L0221_14445, partial [Chloroflexi bacterium]|nr:hypothetical protein [Chloroflexota bacterium]